jgi:hypothetical protein
MSMSLSQARELALQIQEQADKERRELLRLTQGEEMDRQEYRQNYHKRKKYLFEKIARIKRSRFPNEEEIEDIMTEIRRNAQEYVKINFTEAWDALAKI